GNAVELDTDAGQVATLTVDDTANHNINATESSSVAFTVGGLDDAGTGTVTFTDGTSSVVVNVTGIGGYHADLSTLADGQITSSLSFTDVDGNAASATGNAVELDTDAGQVATLTVDDTANHNINATESSSVAFTVGGLDDAGTGTVTFTDGTSSVVVNVTGNGGYHADLSTLADGQITSSLSFTDVDGNAASATGNAVELDTDAGQVATLTVDDTGNNINATESTAVS